MYQRRFGVIWLKIEGVMCVLGLQSRYKKECSCGLDMYVRVVEYVKVVVVMCDTRV